MPYIGALFRRVQHHNNEIELLILVTPELVDAMDAEEVPPCGPGTRTANPNDWDLYLRGHLEVPECCPPGGPGCEACAGTGEREMIGGWGAEDAPGGTTFPEEGEIVEPPAPRNAPMPPPVPADDAAAHGGGLQVRPASATGPRRTAPRPYSPPRRENPQPSPKRSGSAGGSPAPVFIGPIGYDVLK